MVKKRFRICTAKGGFTILLTTNPEKRMSKGTHANPLFKYVLFIKGFIARLERQPQNRERQAWVLRIFHDGANFRPPTRKFDVPSLQLQNSVRKNNWYVTMFTAFYEYIAASDRQSICKFHVVLAKYCLSIVVYR